LTQFAAFGESMEEDDGNWKERVLELGKALHDLVKEQEGQPEASKVTNITK